MATPTVPETPFSATIESLQVGASELVRLRWVAVAGQLLTVASVRYLLDISVPILPLSILIGATAVSNALLAAWVAGHRRLEFGEFSRAAADNQEPREPPVWLLAMVLALDLILLTSMLYYTGGVSNPFSVFYLVNLGLCAFVVDRRLAWGLYGLASLGFAWLLFFHIDLPDLGFAPSSMARPPQQRILSWGSFVAFLMCGGVIVHFSSRFHQELRKREHELRRAGEQRARSEKLEALGTLAAGAAHELATPLSTIAVVVKEVERALALQSLSPELRDDMSLIRREVDRCRAILDRMAGDAGQPSGERPIECSIRKLIDSILGGLQDATNIHLQLEADADRPCMKLPLEATAQAIRGLVKNGLDASPPGLSVVVSGAIGSTGFVEIRIRDRGEGMSDAILQRISEPFFTTKPPGFGMGLGVFLARTVIERLGGQLMYESAPLRGTTALVKLPIHLSTSA